ncbi:MAG: rod shape-determining protein MreC [Gammaproteobacteria bacterium]
MFTRGPSLGMRLFLLAVCSILLMYLDHQRGHLQTVRQALSVAAYPIRVIVDVPSRAFLWAGDSLITRRSLQQDNARLREARLEARVRLQRLEALQAENDRLRALLESRPRLPDRILVAEILSVDLDPFRHRLVIDKGMTDGLYVGQAMLDAEGLVGQVTRVEQLSAEAIMISDPGHATPVEINRNGLRTIALGTGDSGRLLLPFLPNNADVQAGDLLITSGLGDAFPYGYPVARVLAVDRRPGEPFAEILAEPTAALNREREVLLVWQQDRAPEQIVSDEMAPGEMVPDDIAPGDDGGATEAAADPVEPGR